MRINQFSVCWILRWHFPFFLFDSIIQGGFSLISFPWIWDFTSVQIIFSAKLSNCNCNSYKFREFASQHQRRHESNSSRKTTPTVANNDSTIKMRRALLDGRCVCSSVVLREKDYRTWQYDNDALESFMSRRRASIIPIIWQRKSCLLSIQQFNINAHNYYTKCKTTFLLIFRNVSRFLIFPICNFAEYELWKLVGKKGSTWISDIRNIWKMKKRVEDNENKQPHDDRDEADVLRKNKSLYGFSFKLVGFKPNR